MSSFVEPSSIVLIIGAICIFMFIMHGLWFSNKPQNRQLKMNNQHDVELSKSSNVGKVRIVTNDPAGNDEVKINSTPARQGTVQKQVRISDSFDDDYNASQASVSVNPKAKRVQINDSSLSGMMQEGQDAAQSTAARQQVNVRIEPSTSNVGGSMESSNTPSNTPWLKNYEIIIVASPDRPYLGEEIEALCYNNGLLPGFVDNGYKIYVVYENVEEKTDEVFRICSMEKPFCFPEDMSGFKTSALALYMPLPPKGKGSAYFRALKMAAEIFLHQLGGQLQDSSHHIITPERLEEMAKGLETYDLS